MRVGHDGLGRVASDKTPGFHDHDLIGDRRDETDVVLDDKNRGSLALEDSQQVSEPRDLFSGEANSRLVEQQQGGTACGSADQFDQLVMTEADLTGGDIGEMREAKTLQLGAGDALRRALAGSVREMIKAGDDVFEDGEVRDKTRDLKRTTDGDGAAMDGDAEHVFTPKHDSSLCRSFDAGNDVE